MGILDKISARLTERSQEKDAVFAIYNALVERARQPALYEKFDIPDTLDGRFDSIVLHMVLFNAATGEGLKTEAGYEKFGDDLIYVFLKDMDRNLREIGVGDLSVGKKVKKMSSAYYGRAAAYEEALSSKTPDAKLREALVRNLYRGEKVAPAKSKGLARYALAFAKSLENLSVADIRQGRLEVKR